MLDLPMINRIWREYDLYQVAYIFHILTQIFMYLQQVICVSFKGMFIYLQQSHRTTVLGRRRHCLRFSSFLVLFCFRSLAYIGFCFMFGSGKIIKRIPLIRKNIVAYKVIPMQLCINHLFELNSYALSLSVSEVSTTKTCYSRLLVYVCLLFFFFFFFNFGIYFCVFYFAHSFDFIFRFSVYVSESVCRSVRVSHQHINQQA